MRVHVGDPELVLPLLEYFERQADCVAFQIGEAELEVSLLGSYRNEIHDATVTQLAADFQARKRAAPPRPALRLTDGGSRA